MSEAAEELYPELVIEHAICCLPINGIGAGVEESLAGRFQGDREICNLAEIAVSYREVFRTYDVLPPHSFATTLDRAAHLLPLAKGFLNVEDELYLAAALGCQMGIMRSPAGIGLDEWDDSDRLSEADAAVAWQHTAPPFAGGVCTASDEILFDDYRFREAEVWCEIVNDSLVLQGAPAAVARNAELPLVRAGKTGYKPFVVCTQFAGGAFAVGVFPRTVNGKRGYVGGEVVCRMREKCGCVAIFGKMDRVELLTGGVGIRSVTAKSLIGGDSVVDLSGAIAGGGIVVDGDMLGKISGASDLSAPAVELHIVYED